MSIRCFSHLFESQRLAHGEHRVAHALIAGTQDLSRLNAFQVLADRRAASILKAGGVKDVLLELFNKIIGA